MRKLLLLTLPLLLLATAPDLPEVPVQLKGSPASMERQHEVAEESGYSFVEEPSDVETLADVGRIVEVEGDSNFTVLSSVSYPIARPELKLFIERLAAEYHAATGEKLVVTSLTRPQSTQPRNAHQLSVHPTGLAVDLRISSQQSSREWLEENLLALERQGLLDITRERWPPHYHIALFPEAYRSYLLDRMSSEELAAALRWEEAPDLTAEQDTSITTASNGAGNVWISQMLVAVTVLLTFVVGLFYRTKKKTADDTVDLS